MDLYFVNAQLRKFCSSEKNLVRKFGDRRGKVIAVRFSELRALPSLASGFQIPHLGLHQLMADRDETFAVKVIDPYRMVLEPGVSPLPRRDDGGLALERVVAVIVTEIVDYH